MKNKEYYESLDKRTKEYKEWKESQRKGLGDYVEDVTKATGIKKMVGDCEGCNKRKEALNRISKNFTDLFRRIKPNDFTEEQAKEWQEFVNRENQKIITRKQQELIIRLLKDILRMSVKPCGTCSASLWLKYIDMLEARYNQQFNK